MLIKIDKTYEGMYGNNDNPYIPKSKNIHTNEKESFKNILEKEINKDETTTRVI